jgi:hypothetical protein
MSAYSVTVAGLLLFARSKNRHGHSASKAYYMNHTNGTQMGFARLRISSRILCED